MSHKVTAKNGPLDGKTFLVNENATTFTHHAAPGGTYKVNTKTATWQPAQAIEQDPEPTPSPEG